MNRYTKTRTKGLSLIIITAMLMLMLPTIASAGSVTTPVISNISLGNLTLTADGENTWIVSRGLTLTRIGQTSLTFDVPVQKSSASDIGIQAYGGVAGTELLTLSSTATTTIQNLLFNFGPGDDEKVLGKDVNSTYAMAIGTVNASVEEDPLVTRVELSIYATDTVARPDPLIITLKLTQPYVTEFTSANMSITPSETITNTYTLAPDAAGAIGATAMTFNRDIKKTADTDITVRAYNEATLLTPTPTNEALLKNLFFSFGATEPTMLGKTLTDDYDALLANIDLYAGGHVTKLEYDILNTEENAKTTIGLNIMPLVSNGTITGTILAPNAPSSTANLAGVDVSLDGTAYSATTDANGAFTISNVPVGNYTIKMSKANYCGIQDNITVVGGTNSISSKTLYLWGDVNGDSYINVDDAAAIVTFFVKAAPLAIPSVGDVNEDSYINVDDAAAVVTLFVKGTPLPINQTI